MTDPTRQHPSDGPAPSLHVDSDWKAQAEAERTRLAEKEAALQARTAEGGPEQLPPAEFRSLVGLLASQAVMGLGTMADPQGRVVVDLEGSKFAIDLLKVLEEKTKGNLTPEEAGEIEEVNRELAMRFTAITRIKSSPTLGNALQVGRPPSPYWPVGHRISYYYHPRPAKVRVCFFFFSFERTI